MDSWTLVSLCSSICSEAIHSTLPYVVAVYMVRDFLGEGADEQSVGRYTGALTSFYFVGQFLSAYIWGRMSDSYGRKPVLILSNISATVMGLWYGSAGNYTSAGLARFIPSFFSCTFGMVRSVVADNCSVQTQAVIGGYVTVFWSLGSILGPAIGGGLSSPCNWLPSTLAVCKDNGLFQRRKYLLPCLIASTISLISAVLCTFVLKESGRPKGVFPSVPAVPLEEGPTSDNTVLEQGMGAEPWLEVGTPKGGSLSTALSCHPGHRVLSCSTSLESPRPSGSRKPSFSQSLHRKIAELGEAGLTDSTAPSGQLSSQTLFRRVARSTSAPVTPRNPDSGIGLASSPSCLKAGDVNLYGHPGRSPADTGGTSGHAWQSQKRISQASSVEPPSEDQAVREHCEAPALMTEGRGPTWILSTSRSTGDPSEATTAVNGDDFVFQDVLAPQRPGDENETMSDASNPFQFMKEAAVDTISNCVESSGYVRPFKQSPSCSSAQTQRVRAGSLEAPSQSDTGLHVDLIGELFAKEPLPMQKPSSALSASMMQLASGESPPSLQHVADAATDYPGMETGSQPPLEIEDRLATKGHRQRSVSQVENGQGAKYPGGYGDVERQSELQEPLLYTGQAESSSGDNQLTRWYNDRNLLLLMLGYCLISLFGNITDEVIPLYAASPPMVGGLGLSSGQLALPATISGACLGLWALFGVAKAQAAFGASGCCRIGVVAYAVIALLVPLVSLLHDTRSVISALALILSARGVAGQNAFNGSMLMVIQKTPGVEMGAVNGAVQSFAAFMRAVGPTVGGFAWAQSIHLPVPLHQAFPFCIAACGFAGTHVLYSYLHNHQ